MRQVSVAPNSQGARFLVLYDAKPDTKLCSLDANIGCDNEGTSASASQRPQSDGADVLKKHQGKSTALAVTGRLPDPRAMAGIRSGLEGESSDSEVEEVRNSSYLSVSLS